MLPVKIAIQLSHSSVDIKALASQESMAEVVGQCRPPGNSTWHLADRTEYTYHERIALSKHFPGQEDLVYADCLQCTTMRCRKSFAADSDAAYLLKDP